MIRDFKANMLKNISFILLIALSVLVIIGFNRSMDSYINTIDTLFAQCNAEDGQFSIVGTLTKRQIATLENLYNVKIEKNKVLDENLKEKNEDSTLRILCTDQTINQVALISGRPINSTNEILLDPKFAKANGYSIGDTILICNNTFLICGFGISPNYVYTLKNSSDFLNSPQFFGVGYVSAKGYEKIKPSTTTTTLYSYINNGSQVNELKKHLQDTTTLIEFLERTDNTRMKSIYNDATAPKEMALIMGVLLIIIVAFVISISIKNTITDESQTIGILYSQGFNKGELLSYYMLLPTVLVLIGVIIGYIGGVLISPLVPLMLEPQYTLPTFKITDSLPVIFLGIILPIILALSISYFSISSALNKTPLSLLRGAHANNSVSPIEKVFSFKKLSFFLNFRLKSVIREKGSMLALFFGVLLSMFILSTALHLRDSTNKFIEDLKINLPYEYMYSFKNNNDLYKYSGQGELTSIKTVKIHYKDLIKSINIQGIAADSEFFNIPELHTLKNNEVLVTPSLSIKYNIQVGDTLVLQDDTKKDTYKVFVKGFCNYDYGQYLFTTTAIYNKIFRLHSNSYNALFTHSLLDISNDKIISTNSKSELIASAVNVLSILTTLATVMILVAIGILMSVVYLLLKMIIDKSKVNISMVKIFGYTKSEINKLYLNGNFIILLIAYGIAIPIGYNITKIFYDSIFIDMSQYYLPSIQVSSKVFAFIIMLVAYLCSGFLLKRNINNIPLTEALKNRE